MAVIRLQHVGVGVRDFAAATRALERIGLTTRDFRNNQGKGFQHDSRILLGNDCWLHVVHNWNPDSRVFRFVERHGPGLEHVALETDAIEVEVARLRERGAALFEDRIFDANDGYEFFVFPGNAIGFTVELIQPHSHSWGYPEEARRRAVSEAIGVVKLQHLGVVVRDVKTAALRFAEWFGLRADDVREDRVALGNDCWLHLVEDRDSREGLEHIALETRTLGRDVEFLRQQGVQLSQDRHCGGADGDSVFLLPEEATGLAIELSAPQENVYSRKARVRGLEA